MSQCRTPLTTIPRNITAAAAPQPPAEGASARGLKGGSLGFVASVGIGVASPWVLVAGLLWIVVLTYLCYRGIEISARLQVILLAIEIAMLLVMSILALVKVGTGSAPAGHAAFSWSWLNPAHFASPSTFMAGMLLMVFV
ncbi:MAG TPA: hypothetical protein VGG75_04750 [Trebonia sp.]